MDVFLASTAHRKSLAKLYLESKLRSAEKIMVGLNTMSGILYSLQTLYIHLKQDLNDLEASNSLYIESLEKTVQDQMIKWNESEQFILGTMPLYFDFDDLTSRLIQTMNKFHTNMYNLSKKLSEQFDDHVGESKNSEFLSVIVADIKQMDDVFQEAKTRIRAFALRFEKF
jgi:hypothetical protein